MLSDCPGAAMDLLRPYVMPHMTDEPVSPLLPQVRRESRLTLGDMKVGKLNDFLAKIFRPVPSPILAMLAPR